MSSIPPKDASPESPSILERMALHYQYSNHDTTPGLRYQSPYPATSLRPEKNPGDPPPSEQPLWTSEYYISTKTANTGVTRQESHSWTGTDSTAGLSRQQGETEDVDAQRIEELEEQIAERDREIKSLQFQLNQKEAPNTATVAKPAVFGNLNEPYPQSFGDMAAVETRLCSATTSFSKTWTLQDSRVKIRTLDKARDNDVLVYGLNHEVLHEMKPSGWGENSMTLMGTYKSDQREIPTK
jgi:hypothetical protein